MGLRSIGFRLPAPGAHRLGPWPVGLGLGRGCGGRGSGGAADAAIAGDREAVAAAGQGISWVDSPAMAADALSIIPGAVLRNLSDKLYEKRKNAALEVRDSIPRGLWS